MNKNIFKVSIIIPTYNRSYLLSYTLQSILYQSINLNEIEVVVVDDGSSDNTKDIINEYSARLNLKYFYQEDRGYRVATARNIGIINASGELCIFVDAGIALSSCFIEEHLKSYKITNGHSATIGYVYGFENYDNSNFIKHLIDINDPNSTISYFKKNKIGLDLREKFFDMSEKDFERLPAPWVFFWGGNISISRNILHKIGLFDSDFDLNWGMEDVDLGYRLHKNGIQIILNKEANCIHYPHEKNMDDNERQQKINKLLFHKKYNCNESKLFIFFDCWQLNDKLNENLVKY